MGYGNSPIHETSCSADIKMQWLKRDRIVTRYGVSLQRLMQIGCYFVKSFMKPMRPGSVKYEYYW